MFQDPGPGGFADRAHHPRPPERRGLPVPRGIAAAIGTPPRGGRAQERAPVAARGESVCVPPRAPAPGCRVARPVRLGSCGSRVRVMWQLYIIWGTRRQDAPELSGAVHTYCHWVWVRARGAQGCAHIHRRPALTVHLGRRRCRRRRTVVDRSPPSTPESRPRPAEDRAPRESHRL